MYFNKKVVLQVVSMVLLLQYTYNVYGREAEVFPELITDEDSALDKGDGCLIDINKHLSEPQPLLIHPGTNEFYLPQSKNGELSLKPNEALELFCSKNFLFPMESLQTIMVSCLGKDIVLYNDKSPIPFNKIKCHTHAFHTARHTYQSCYNDSVLIKIGFNITDGRFMDLVDVCYNEVLESTVYTHHIQTPSSIGFQRSVKRPHFIRGEFFKKTANINKLFNKNKQTKIFEQILGHANSSILHLTPNINQSLFLVRGHLTPKVDFLFGSQQRATFWLINAVPQWQSFNSGNWERIEQGVRQLIADRNIVVNIYTGTYGILTYTANGYSNEIFLSHDENNNGVVPVPKLMYKVVLSRNSNSGIVLLRVNNPFAKIDEIQKEYVICDDVGDQVMWVKWDRKNIVKGYSYACELNDFLKVAKDLPFKHYNVTLLL